MEIIIKDKLKELRKEKNITQEQLANHLGISQQSVGKWERGEGYPDITLLPTIALYFGITLDELMGIDEAKIKEAVEKYKTESNALTYLGKTQENLELWQEAYNKLPQNEEVKYEYIHAMWSVWFDHTDENPSMSEDIIKLGTDLLNTSTDVGIRGFTIQLLCFTYNHLGDTENAKKYANMSGSYWVTCNQMLTSVLTGEELVTHCQHNITSLIDLINSNTFVLRREGKYTALEKIHILEFCNNMFKGIFENGDCGFYACRLAENYRDIAYEYALMSNTDECLNALDKVVKYAVMRDTQPDFKHTSLMVNRLEHENAASSKNYTDNECARYLKCLQHETYDFVRDNSRFIKIIEELKKHAN